MYHVFLMNSILFTLSTSNNVFSLFSRLNLKLISLNTLKRKLFLGKHYSNRIYAALNSISPLASHESGKGLSIYDLHTSSVSFNIFEFLEHQQHYLSSLGCSSAHLAIIFNPAAFNLQLASLIEWKLLNIIQPAISLYPYFNSFEVSTDYTSIAYNMNRKPSLKLICKHPFLDSVQLYKQYLVSPDKLIGITLPKQAATISEQYCLRNNLDLSNTILITLRFTSWDPSRNSNLTAWNSFAEYLFKHNKPYAVIPDFDCPNIDSHKYPYLHRCLLHEPSWNIFLRSSLYTNCLLHFCIPNGPSILSVLNRHSRYIFMNFLPSDSLSTTYEVLKAHNLHKLNGRYEFGLLHQYVFYESDTLENILDSYHIFTHRLSSHGK